MSSVAYAELRNADGWVSPVRFSASHDLLHYLVPYDHFQVDPWDRLHQLGEFFESLPETASTWAWADTEYFSHAGCCKPRRRLFCTILGAWPLNYGSDRRNLSVNPYYNQLDRVDWTPDEHKVVHWLRMALVGKWTTRDACGRYNNNSAVVDEMFKARGMTWGGMQQLGRERVANTVLVTREWTGRSVADCARAMDMPARTLRQWVNRYATLDPVPQRPAEQGFGSGW